VDKNGGLADYAECGSKAMVMVMVMIMVVEERMGDWVE
jgi:hypothetical protein